jgi:sugar/nucleoside kinase (ribokinase family)
MVIESISSIVVCRTTRLGLKVTFAGPAGSDEFGRFMLVAMEDRSINTTFCTLDPVVLIGLSGILSLPGD